MHNQVLVYVKNKSSEFITEAMEIIKNELKDTSLAIFVYGQYTADTYFKTLMSRPQYMITLDGSESQGFALQEAMAMNIPLLVCDANDLRDNYPADNHFQIPESPAEIPATSVPLWNDHCGIKIKDLGELSSAIHHMNDHYQEYSPRNLIIDQLNPKLCLQRFLEPFVQYL